VAAVRDRRYRGAKIGSLDGEGCRVSMAVTQWARPRDQDQLWATVRACSAQCGIEFVYGGLHTEGGVQLSSFIGARTGGLKGLLVRPGWGLGGKAFAARRPETVTDYAADSGITHDYDRPVLGEGIRSVTAVPVVVAQQTRGLLYAATRTESPIAGRVIDGMVQQARRLAARLRIEDEVDMRVQLIGAAPPAGTPDLQDVYRELRAIAQLVDDPAVRRRLLQATQRLAGPPPATADPGPGLAPREIDVLAEVALGCSNREIADRLSLATETVKAYLKSASRKLGANNRLQAVFEARRRGLLP
jgi:LuxR family transcriptional regulator, regulator of acetate metabolism